MPDIVVYKRSPFLNSIDKSVIRGIEEVGLHFCREESGWSPGTRCDDASRSVAAYLSRRCFGYRAKAVTEALGYRSHGSIHSAIARVESGGSKLKKTTDLLAKQLHY